MKLYAQINKVDAAQQMVWGYASTEAIDSQGEIVTKDAIKGAWDDYMEFANVREMHQPSAVGVVKEYEFNDEGVKIGVKVVDSNAWNKVVEGVYKGFSIGGSKLPGGYDELTKTISAMKLTEISLVDRPSNPKSLIEMFKADNLKEFDMSKKVGTTPVDEIAGLVAKGNITPERLLELIDADIKKSAEEKEAAEMTDEEKEAAKKKKENEEDEETTKAEDSDESTAEEKEEDKKKKEDDEEAEDDLTDKKEAKKSDQITNLQKCLSLLGSTDKTEVKKGLYNVACFAELLESLAWLQENVAYEADWEADNSSLPAKIAGAINLLGSLLVEMAAEETAELVRSMGVDADPITVLNEAVEQAAKNNGLEKFQNVFDVVKSASVVNNGVEIKKVDADQDIKKALASFEKTTGELSALKKSFISVKGELEVLKQAFAKSPTAPKGLLKVIEKSHDIDPTTAITEASPVLKQDGSVDEIATAIKKVHQSGGRTMFSPR